MAESENTHGTAVEGGKYIQGGRYVDAEGKDLGAAPKSATEAQNDVVPVETPTAPARTADDTARKGK